MTGIIISAAGQSSRLGRPKQLLRYQGETLIRRAIKAATNSSAVCTLVVTGAYHAEVLPELFHEPISYVFNPDWEQGMSSSIGCGLHTLLELNPTLDNVIIMLCDQPYVTSSLLDRLIAVKIETCKGIVACGYADTIGTPALFSKNYFTELLNLSGSKGAKSLLRTYAADLATLTFPQGAIDIDTEADYQDLEP